MATAAELFTEARDGDYADHVAIFLTKESHSAGFLCFFDRHFRDVHIGAFDDFIIDDLFHFCQLFRGKWFRPGEIETETVREHERAGLVHLVAQYAAQRCLQHMGAGVVSGQIFSSFSIHGDGDGLTFADEAFGNGTDHVHNAIRKFLGIFYKDCAFFTDDGAGVADLSAAFCVEWIIFQHHSDFGAISSGSDFLAIFAEEQKLRHAISVFGGEFHAFQLRGVRGSDFRRNLRTSGSRSFFLFCHSGFEAFFIDGHALFLGDFIGEFPGETIGIVEFEYLVAGEDGAIFLLGIFEHFREKVGACIQSRMEAVFFDASYSLDEFLLVYQFRIRRFHHIDNYVDHLAHESVLDAKQFPVANSTAQDAAKYIAAAFIGRQDAISDHVCDSAGMVGNDLQRHVAIGSLAIFHTGQGRSFFDNREEKVGFKVVLFLLHDSGETFEASAGIDVFLRQRNAAAVFLLVELGKYQVPDFQETIAVAAHLVFRIGAEFFALVVENFGVRAAGAFADFPEIIFQRIDMTFRNAYQVVPVAIGFFIIRVNGDIEAGFVEHQDFRQKFPSPGDGFLLEIVAKGEVPQHFEESMVASRMAYVFDIAGTDTLLAGGDSMLRWFYLAGEIRLQRRHAGTNQKKTGIILWDQRETFQSQMVFFIFKE